MEHFPTRPREESTMIKSTRPKLNRFTYPAMLLGALAVAAFPPVGLTAVATAEPEWDIGIYDNCIAENGDSIASQHSCCDRSGGVWIPRRVADNNSGKCVAPAANQQAVQPPDGTSPPQGPNLVPRGSVPTAGNPAP